MGSYKFFRNDSIFKFIRKKIISFQTEYKNFPSKLIDFPIQRVLVSADENQGNKDSKLPMISSNANYLVFDRYANNLVPGDTNGKADVFIFDRNNEIIKRITINNDGYQSNDDSFAPSVNEKGKFITFSSASGNLIDWRQYLPLIYPENEII